MRFYFYLISQVIIDHTGYCSYSISQFSKVCTSGYVYFNATLVQLIETPDSTPSLRNSTDICPPDRRSIMYGGLTYCVLPCTEDQVVDNSTGFCIAVDCKIKYNNTRNTYDFNTNTCIQNPDLCTSGNCNIPANPLNGNNSTPFIPVPILTELSCNNGVLAADNHSCVCDEGWTQGFNQDPFNYTFCDIKEPTTSHSKLNIVSILFTVFAVLIGLCCCGLCGYCCFKFKLYKKLPTLKFVEKKLDKVDANFGVAMRNMGFTEDVSEIEIPSKIDISLDSTK